MILIIGSKEEEHARYVYDKLGAYHVGVEYFDSRRFPDEILISYAPNSDEGYLKIGGKKIYLKDVKGVYWRSFYGINYSDFGDDFVSKMVYRERKSALNSFFRSLRCNWVNSFEAVEMHKTKVYQLDVMKKNNIRIPKTLVTNDEEALVEFFENNNKNVIYKPVLGGALTKKLNEDDLKKENLKTLKTSPIQLQEYIDGIDIRAYVLGDNIYASKILAKTVDFRGDGFAKIEPIELPYEVQKDCIKILKLLNLEYSGIDIKKNNEDEYVFIEANPAPMFINFEKMTKYPISKKLIELLLKD